MSGLQIPKYDVEAKRTELVMIVNEKFTDNFSSRPWATKDATLLRKCFPNCKLVYKENQTASAMQDTFTNLSTDIDCLVVFVSSYGQPGSVLGADGGSRFTVTKMLDMVNEKEALAGKPLVFILQTCDITKHIAQADGVKNNDSKDTWTIPSTADNFAVQSLYPGRQGGDDRDEYSLFISTLCSELEGNANKCNDIRHIMTRVMARMKNKIEADNEPEARRSMMKLLPIQVSTLTKQLFL